MPPKKSDSSEGTPSGLTESELRFIKAVFDNMTQKPDADWDKVADHLGLKDAKCAKERFRQMSVRHGWREQACPSPKKGKNGATGPSGDGKVTKQRQPRTPRKKAAKKEESDDDVADDKESVKAEEDEA